ncbi:MAG: hypothetical protein GWO24_04510 [Akkermansiaceae bacterium]|nr:hypothetical protein [Akkermansiaceae bacterium]
MSEETNGATPETPEPASEESSESVIDFLKRQRDELKLQMHLGSQEAKEQWDRLEEKWRELGDWGEPLTSAAKEAAETAGDQAKKVTGAALDLAAREIRSGYEKLRKLLE